MKHTPTTTKGKVLVDCIGTKIPTVLEWDDETEEALIGLSGKSELGPKGQLLVVTPVVADLSGCHPIGKFEMLTIRIKIPGAKLVDK